MWVIFTVISVIHLYFPGLLLYPLIQAASLLSGCSSKTPVRPSFSSGALLNENCHHHSSLTRSPLGHPRARDHSRNLELVSRHIYHLLPRTDAVQTFLASGWVHLLVLKLTILCGSTESSFSISSRRL